jgi:cytochrome c2
MMPRLDLTPAMARSIAAALVPSELALSPRQDGDLAAGRRLLETSGCGTCHRFSGVPEVPASPLLVPLPAVQLAEAIALAPDLRHTRERFQPGALVGWLRAPASLKPDTRMPQIPLSNQQASDLAAYILTVPLQPVIHSHVPARLPVLSRRVSFDEVNEQVFRRTCWHCHSTPEYAMGDGGPGNTGGFGFPGRGLNVATYADLASGSLDDHGQRRSVFLPVADGTPRLLAVLLARQREMHDDIVPGLRGMPLGLPALSPEQIQLVESWIRQGRPQ